MDSIARGIEAAACTILQHLGQTFSGAEVDYESFDGLHNFKTGLAFGSSSPTKLCYERVRTR